MGLRSHIAGKSCGAKPATGFFLPLAGATLLLAFLPPQARLELIFDRAAIAGGEVWRLLTCHLVHLGWRHLLLNLAGLLLVAVAAGRQMTVPAWSAAGLAVALGGSLGVLAFSPETTSMAGLSGLLHGLFAAGALAELRQGSRGAALSMLALLAGKLLSEQLHGPLAGTGTALGGPVAIDAHLYSSLVGLATGLPALRLRARHANARRSPRC